MPPGTGVPAANGVGADAPTVCGGGGGVDTAGLLLSLRSLLLLRGCQVEGAGVCPAPLLPKPGAVGLSPLPAGDSGGVKVSGDDGAGTRAWNHLARSITEASGGAVAASDAAAIDPPGPAFNFGFDPGVTGFSLTAKGVDSFFVSSSAAEAEAEAEAAVCSFSASAAAAPDRAGAQSLYIQRPPRHTIPFNSIHEGINMWWMTG